MAYVYVNLNNLSIRKGKHSPSSKVLTMSGEVYGPGPMVTALTLHI